MLPSRLRELVFSPDVYPFASFLTERGVSFEGSGGADRSFSARNACAHCVGGVPALFAAPCDPLPKAARFDSVH